MRHETTMKLTKEGSKFNSIINILTINILISSIIEIQFNFTLKIKNPQTIKFEDFCGELGIRTPGPVTVNSFQDYRNRPLCQLSIKTFPFSVVQI